MELAGGLNNSVLIRWARSWEVVKGEVECKVMEEGVKEEGVKEVGVWEEHEWK